MSYGSFHDDGRRRNDVWPYGPSGPVGPGRPDPPAPKAKPSTSPKPAQKKTWIRPDKGMPIEMVICSGKPTYVISRFCYNSWFLRDDMWERHRWEIQGIARDVIDRWRSTRRVKHICLMGHTDFHGPDEYNIQLGRARANTVRDALCEALTYIAKCQNQIEILTKLTIACGTAGKSAPRALGKSDDARACNRRVEVYLQDFESDGRKCPITIPIPRPIPGGPTLI